MSPEGGSPMFHTGLLFLLIGSALIVPAVILFGGAVMRRIVPSEPDRLIGYRTELSMRNQETWDFANKYCGKLWGRLGWILLGASLAAAIIAMVLITQNISGPRAAEAVYTWTVLGITTAQVVCMLISIAFVEKQLHRYFYDDGTRKESV